MLLLYYSIKAGESRGRAPGQASDYALRAPNPLDSNAMTRCFIKISGPPNQSGPQVFCPPPCPPALAGPVQYTTTLLQYTTTLLQYTTTILQYTTVVSAGSIGVLQYTDSLGWQPCCTVEYYSSLGWQPVCTTVYYSSLGWQPCCTIVNYSSPG